MQQVDDPPYLQVGTEVSAKYKGAFCEAKVSEVVRNIKVKVAYKQGLGSGVVSDDDIKASPGQLRVGAVVEVRHPDRKDYVEATVTKIQDCSQYTVVFDDGDITTLRRTALCIKSGRHFNESETLDQLPLTHPEHFGNPVVGGRRGRRRGHMNDDSSDEDDESDAKEVVNEKEEHIGKVVCVETESKKKDKEKWFPGLVVAPTAQATVRIRVKDEYLVRSFKDGRYYTVPKKEATEFTREAAAKQDGPAVQAALEYLDSDVLPPHWDRDALFGLSNSSSENEDEIDSDSSDDEPREEKDRFVAQLYKYMDDRGTPLNKVPSIQNKDVDLYRLFRAVQKRGGYNRVTSQNQWKSIALRLGFAPVTVSITNLVKQAFKKFLQPYGEFHRKLGCSMLMSPRNSNRSKGRSLVRANSVASPKPQDVNKEVSTPISKLATTSTSSSSLALASITSSSAAANTSLTEESENTSESSSQETVQKNKRKSSLGGASTSSTKVKSLVEKYEEKTVKDKDEGDVPLSKIKAAAANKEREREDAKEKEREKEREREREKEKEREREKEREKEKEKEREREREREKEREKEKEKEREREKEREKEKEKEREREQREREREREKEKEKESGGSKDSSGQVTRDSSPSGSNISNKKDKTQRKQSSQNDDKRSKRRKDEIVVEKIDTGDFVVETGDKLKVYYHEKKVTYEAKVIEITLQRGTPMYLVHYTGWNNRYDEWVPRERIAENLTKGSKFKGGGRASSSSEKSKENPPKPPSAASLASTPAGSAANSAGSSTSSSTQQQLISTSKTPNAAGKRGRGRSDSMPPRSTTPSSVASNSSRTKSPATSSALKKRPQRQTPNSARRTSANVSDVSIATEEESDTDSDEPVKRPTIRNMKESAKGVKSPAKSKMSISAPNSQSDTDDQDDDDDDDEEEDLPSTSKSLVQRKGRDYDLNQIRSELKGFQSIKTSIENEDSVKETKDSKDSSNLGKIKTEKSEFEMKSSANTSNSSLNLKEECKREPKDEPRKRSSTEMSSETDSFGDDESQSSDKTTQLENMRKKFQQIINAEKLRSLDKSQLSSKSATSLGNTRVVEKIIKERESEKRQETLKAKPFIKDETKSSIGVINIKQEPDLKTESTPLKEEEKKPLLNTTTETKTVILQPTRFPASATSSSTLSMPSKYTSVIVEKPLSVAKKLETSFGKKLETPKKGSLTESLLSHSQSVKKFIEPTNHKEILKVEPPAACSPSSTSSTSSSTSSSSNTSSSSGSRFLPDMSKLDISGSSSSTSTSLSSPSTTSTSSTSYASACAKETKVSSSLINKPNSPDIYEFKDNEPFEFEIRKSPMVQSNASSVITANLGAATTSSNSITQRNKSVGKSDHHSSLGANPMSALVNRKKRGSPMKESVIEKAKLLKIEEKTTTPSPLVADAKLVHHSMTSTATTITGTTSSQIKMQMSAQTKTTVGGTAMHAPALPKSIPPSNTPASSVSSLLAPVITPQKQPGDNSAFDTLRKSPSFNLNINALNEELAQTVQETTRALTDALQSPQPPAVLNNPTEITPTKTIPEKSSALPSSGVVSAHTTAALPANTTVQSIVASPKLSTPPSTATAPTAKPQVGSPFIETRSVFELSFGAGSSSRENKFELENAKVMLSATGGAFDFDPSKLETKPTTSSIADKVLKAISQKKEEEENKKQEAAAGQNKDKETTDTKEDKPVTSINLGLSALPSLLTSSLNSTSIIKSSLESLTQTNPFNTSSASLLSEPLKINTDITSSSGLLSGPLNTFLANKRTPLTSPEPKMGILESMGGTKNQLSETIQKLECAIQRRTPVTSHPVTPTTPLSSTNPETFSDDTNDSTDSERRLVIEDVADDSGATTTPVEQKPSPVLLGPESCKPSATAVKLETTMGSAKVAYATHHDIPAPIPIKAVTSSTLARSPLTPSVVTTTTTSTNLISVTPNNAPVSSKIPTQNTAAVVYQNAPKPVIQANPQQTLSSSSITQTIQKSVLIMPTAGAQNQTQIAGDKKHEVTSHLGQLTGGGGSGSNVSTPHKLATSSVRPSNPTVTASAGVPIVLPDIPASVVVASTAVPSVMAAAQAAAAALQTPKQTPQKQTHQIVVSQAQQSLAATITKSNLVTTTSTLHPNPTQTLIPTPSPVQASNPTAFVSTAKTFENSTTIRHIPQNLKPITTSGLIQTPSKGGFQPLSAPTNPTPAPTSTSGFYLDPRTELRPDDGLKPLGDIPKPSNLPLINPMIHTNLATKEIAPPPPSSTLAAVASTSSTVESTSAALPDAHNDSIIQLRCEETIPGSPASVITGREDSQERTATSLMPDSNVAADKDFSTIQSNKSLPTGSLAAATAVTISATTTATATTSSSPNDSCSQEDESSEDLKKSVDVENEVSPRKRRRPRKQTENSSLTTDQQQQQTHHQHSKRRRQLPCNKKNTVGSDSDDNSDNVSQRSTHHASRHQQHNVSQQQTQPSTTTPGSKPCPYNFLVQLDPSLTPDQCIAILLKQIQDLRKTYNIIKTDLASIDRRRKKLRRREREKKQQQLQNQQQMKVGS